MKDDLREIRFQSTKEIKNISENFMKGLLRRTLKKSSRIGSEAWISV